VEDGRAGCLAGARRRARRHRPGRPGHLAHDGAGWSWIRKHGTEADHAADAREGWEHIKRELAAETYRFYLLDEFTYPVKWGWVDVADVVETLRGRPGNQHVVITGRDADPLLVGAADLVVEMTKVKHPMDTGQKGQPGIEW
jgi:cob(I)alamin adenosyltransferase